MQDTDAARFELRLSRTLHDLSGPMLTARGFAAELRLSRESALALLALLAPETDPEIIQNLKDQIDTEMDHCLFRIDESLSRLDASIESLRAAGRCRRADNDLLLQLVPGFEHDPDNQQTD